MYDFTNVDPVKCCTWLVLPTVYDESLSYGEQLNKFCKALNELIENNNNIPDYVAEMIQNYITSGAIDEVVRNILANYILNVKYPPKGVTPAVGDGSADDTSAIQGCIDYAFNHGGGCVYFPYGKYLSRSLTLRSGVSLVGFDRYSTKIVQRGGDTKPLVSGGNVQNVQISNLTLDGNNEVQTDDLDVVNVLGKDCLFTNLVIKSGFQCFVYNGLGGDLQVDNVVFGGAVKKVAVINGKDSVQFENVKFNELGKIKGECVLEVSASDGVYRFSSKAVTPVCIKCVGNRNSFIADITNSANNFVDSGVMNNFNVLGAEVKEQLAKGKSYTGGSVSANITGGKTENISNNREIVIDGDDSVHVDGISSVNIGGARTEVYGNSRSVGVNGTNTEEYHDTMNETFNKKHNVKGQDETNTFSGNIDNTANKFTFNSKEKAFILHFPDKNKNLYENYSPYNVKELGCVGDGITDDTDALQNIINNYQGELIFLPKGKYLITKTLILPNSTHIEGCGEDSVIIPDNSFTDIIIKSSHYGDDTNIYDANFKLVNFTIDGGYADYINYIKKRGDLTTQHGICIKGEQFELDKMIIRNCGGNGFMVYNNTNRIVTNFGTAGTSYIINSKIMFNARHGIVSDGAVDWVLHNSTIHSNSRRAMNDSNNLDILSGNCKISDCHFFSLYGNIKPYASVAIEKKASSVEMVNCHIEGASNPLVLYGYRCFFSNCRFYSSFEYCDVRMDADDCCFIGCEFYPQVTDDVPGNYPNFLGAFVFEKNEPTVQRNNRLVLKGCSLHQTKFTSSTVNLGYNNNIELNGTSNEVGAIDFSKCSYFINGSMNQGAQTLYSTPFGFPIASTVGIFDIDSVDVNLSSTYNFINSIGSGNLVIMKPSLGMLCLIMNETNQNVVLKAPTNCLINGIPSITLLPYSLNFFLGQSDSSWKWHSTKR